MKRMRMIMAVVLAALAGPAAADEKPVAASGKTQVVARAAGKEITLSQLRLEMARLGLSAADPEAERAALQSLVNRTVLANAARSASLHKRPEGLARMYAAQDQALADYYLAIASQPAEPTDQEIEAFIAANPTLFARRRAYDFIVMSIETKNFDEKTLTPLFDEEENFDRLASVLQKAGARYSIATASETGAAFPPPIREQLARYDVRDNIVIKGDATTQILKIAAIRNDPMPQREQGALARRLVLEERAGARMQDTLARLTKGADIAYYRPSAAPRTAPTPKSAQRQRDGN